MRERAKRRSGRSRKEEPGGERSGADEQESASHEERREDGDMEASVDDEEKELDEVSIVLDENDQVETVKSTGHPPNHPKKHSCSLSSDLPHVRRTSDSIKSGLSDVVGFPRL